MNTKKEYIRPNIACTAMDTYAPIATSPSIPVSDTDANQDASSNRFDFRMWEEEEE